MKYMIGSNVNNYLVVRHSTCSFVASHKNWALQGAVLFSQVHKWVISLPYTLTLNWITTFCFLLFQEIMPLMKTQ